MSGCDNGMVYLFRACSEDASTLAVRGGVRALTVKESMVFCGGAGGIVKVTTCRIYRIYIMIFLTDACFVHVLFLGNFYFTILLK